MLMFMVGAAHQLAAQKKYEQKMEKDNVVVYGKWNPSKFLKKDSPLTLCLMVKNNSSEAVEVTLQTSYYEKGKRVEGSAPMKLTVKPGKKVKGRKNGMCWIAAEKSNDELKSDDFEWEVDDIKVKIIPAEKKE